MFQSQVRVEERERLGDERSECQRLRLQLIVVLLRCEMPLRRGQVEDDR